MSAAAITSDAQLALLTCWSEIASIEEEWRDLHARANGHLFSDFDWLAVQETVFDRNEKLCAAILREDGRIVAAVPLVAGQAPVSKLIKAFRPPTLGLMSCRYSGFQEVLADTTPQAARLGATLAARLDNYNLDLNTLVDDGATAEFLRSLENAGYSATRMPNFTSVQISGAQSFETYLSGRTRNFRKSLKRADRTLAAQGFSFDVPKLCDASVIERLLDVSRRSWKHAAGSGIAAQSENTAFVRSVLTHCTGRFSTRVGFLAGPDGDIAFAIAVLHGQTSYFIWSEFDEAYEALSPGRSVIAHLIAQHLEAGEVLAIDLLRKTHFTSSFSEETYAIDRVRAFPCNGVSHILSETDTFARRIAGAVRKGKRKSIRRADIKEGPIAEKEDT